MYYPQRPVNAYYPRPVSPVMSMSPIYTPGSYAGSYYDHCPHLIHRVLHHRSNPSSAPEMRIVPLYPQYAQPLPQPTMIYRQPPVLYNRLVYRQNQSCCSTPCCDDICCDRCCDECCGSVRSLSCPPELANVGVSGRIVAVRTFSTVLYRSVHVNLSVCLPTTTTLLYRHPIPLFSWQNSVFSFSRAIKSNLCIFRLA